MRLHGQFGRTQSLSTAGLAYVVTGSAKQSGVTELLSSSTRCAIPFHRLSSPRFTYVLRYGTGFVVPVSLLDAVTPKLPP